MGHCSCKGLRDGPAATAAMKEPKLPAAAAFGLAVVGKRGWGVVKKQRRRSTQPPHVAVP